MTATIKAVLRPLCILLYITDCYASDKDQYEYLPQIAVPAIRKIIGEYAHNILRYHVKSFTCLPFNCANTDETLPYATVNCMSYLRRGGRWFDFAQHSIAVIPEEQPDLATHISCHDQNSNKLLIPSALQSDDNYKKRYKPLVRLKTYTDNENLRIIFEKQKAYTLDGKYDCLECTPDHTTELTANQVLKKARFDE